MAVLKELSVRDPNFQAPRPEIFRLIRERPAMFLPTVRFDVAAAYVEGINYATRGGLLVGFREWLMVKLDGPDNLVWYGLLERHFRRDSEAIEAHVEVGTLFEMLDEFFSARESEGLLGIFRRYSEKKKRRRD